MLAKSLRRATVLIVFVASLAAVHSSRVLAQQTNQLETLRQQINQFDQAGKYADALTLASRLAAKIEKTETASAGQPGAKTAGALVSVAWHSLLAHNFKEALSASNRAHALAPTNLYVETNRAHALLFSGRFGPAHALYLAHKGQPMSLTDDRMWEDAIADDFEALRKAGLERPAFGKIDAELGGKSTAANSDLAELNQTIRNLARTGNYKEAEAAAERYVALVRQRYSEAHPKFAIAIDLLGSALEKQRRDNEAERLYERSLAIDEKALGPNHAKVGGDLNSLALLYHAQGRYAEAEPLFKRALAIAEKALGPDAATASPRLNNLALLYRAQGRYAEAELL